MLVKYFSSMCSFHWIATLAVTWLAELYYGKCCFHFKKIVQKRVPYLYAFLTKVLWSYMYEGDLKVRDRFQNTTKGFFRYEVMYVIRFERFSRSCNILATATTSNKFIKKKNTTSVPLYIKSRKRQISAVWSFPLCSERER